MSAANSAEDEMTEARLAEAQSKALAQAGLDQRPPLLQSHTRKLSFKDTLKRTFGLKPLIDSTDRVNLTRFDSAPAVSVVPASNANSSPAAAPAPPSGPVYTAGSSDMVRTVSSPPTIGLPPVPIDPALNAKDAKAQNKRLAKLANDQNALKPIMPDGTYGRSASMDVQGTPYYTPASMSDPALPVSGYSSDSEAATLGKVGKGLSGLFKMDRPPTSNTTRYGAGIEGAKLKRGNSGRTRKLSWGRNSTGNTGGTPVTGGGGFFKHRK